MRLLEKLFLILKVCGQFRTFSTPMQERLRTGDFSPRQRGSLTRNRNRLLRMLAKIVSGGSDL